MENTNSVPTVVVVGDWFIDENWIVTKRNISYFDQQKTNHYLSNHPSVDKRMINLCGAPELIEVLRNFLDQNMKYNYIGFGAWNFMDDATLQCILCPNNLNNKFLTPYTIFNLQIPISNKKSNRNDNERICPYDSERQCTYQPEFINLSISKKQSTNRIIRCYEGYGNIEPKLLYRIDWELPTTELDYSKFTRLKNIDIKAVIIEDHGKGVINEESIEALASILKDKINIIPWYIRSKKDKPSWMTTLDQHKGKIRLNVIDHKIALKKMGRRNCRKGKTIARSALEIVGALAGDTIYKHGEKENSTGPRCERAAIYFENNTAIAKDMDRCFDIYKTKNKSSLINIGKTTMFFNALIAQDLCDKFNEDDFGTQCYRACQCAYEWGKQSSSAWSAQEPYFYGNFQTALNTLNKKESEPQLFTINNYKKLWDEWNNSSKDFGYIDPDSDQKIIQLWRGEGALDGYMCVGGPKRSDINDLLLKINNFKYNNTHPFNSLLLSSPGWGKSFLAKSIASHFNMQYLSFSLSQMASTKDLIDCFDIICSAQNRIDQNMLIFFDEINCRIEGHHAMGLLLNPIWDGSFLRDGKLFKLRPAIWVFASTGKLKDLNDENKGSDFLSRLNGPIIELDKIVTATKEKDFSSLRDIMNDIKKGLILTPDFNPYKEMAYTWISNQNGPFRTEQVYLGVSLLNKYWGPISKVQIDVIKLFHDLLLINGFRSLEFFVSKFVNVERGIVYASNVPHIEKLTELSRHVIVPKKWSIKKEAPKDREELVHIESIT